MSTGTVVTKHGQHKYSGTNSVNTNSKNTDDICIVRSRDIISLSLHEKVCLMRLNFERYFSRHWAT